MSGKKPHTGLCTEKKKKKDLFAPAYLYSPSITQDTAAPEQEAEQGQHFSTAYWPHWGQNEPQNKLIPRRNQQLFSEPAQILDI